MNERHRNKHASGEAYEVDNVLIAPFFIFADDIDANRCDETRQNTG